MKKLPFAHMAQWPAERRWAAGRIVLSLAVLGLFFGALLQEYWPDLVSILLRTFNIARTAGTESIASQYFMIRNGSSASERQVRQMVVKLEQDYESIRGYLDFPAQEKLEMLVVNGIGPALIEEKRLVIHFDNGKLQDEIAPLYLVFLISDIPLDLGSPLALPGGYAMQVMEASGIEETLLNQPLDSWTALFRQNGGYMPLEQAWEIELPYDLDAAYDLLVAILESGSFLQWFSSQYGLDAALLLSQGEPIDSLTGRSLAENEQAWLQTVDQNAPQPKSCKTVLPQDSIFRSFCEKIDGSRP